MYNNSINSHSYDGWVIDMEMYIFTRNSGIFTTSGRSECCAHQIYTKMCIHESKCPKLLGSSKSVRVIKPSNHIILQAAPFAMETKIPKYMNCNPRYVKTTVAVLSERNF